MELRFWRRETETRQSGLGGLAGDLLLAQARGQQDADATKTAAAEYGISLVAKSFASAKVSPDLAALGPSARAGIARSLLLKGNYLAALTVSGRTRQIALRRASSWDISGGIDPESWIYHLDMPGPSVTFTDRIASSGVVHCRINTLDSQPWMGRSPLEAAGLSATALANIELRTSQESTARVGYLVPMPEGTTPETLTNVQAHLATIAGNLRLVETTSAGGGAGRSNAPHGDWQPRRLGMNIPASTVELRRDVAADVLSAIGVPSALQHGEGAALREGYRQLLASCVVPLADIVAEELSQKFERPIVFDFRQLIEADIAARARAWNTFIQGGKTPEDADRLTGIK